MALTPEQKMILEADAQVRALQLIVEQMALTICRDEQRPVELLREWASSITAQLDDLDREIGLKPHAPRNAMRQHVDTFFARMMGVFGHRPGEPTGGG